jgi:RNA-directed DNA polymerase
VSRERCWSDDWVLDLDLKSFVDSLVLKAVAHHTDLQWILLYLDRGSKRRFS